MRQEQMQVFGLQNASCMHLWRVQAAVHTAGTVPFCMAAAGWWLHKVAWHTNRWSWHALSFLHPFVVHRPGCGCALPGSYPLQAQQLQAFLEQQPEQAGNGRCQLKKTSAEAAVRWCHKTARPLPLKSITRNGFFWRRIYHWQRACICYRWWYLQNGNFCNSPNLWEQKDS